jgi:hypothetical protein
VLYNVELSVLKSFYIQETDNHWSNLPIKYLPLQLLIHVYAVLKG